MLAEKFKDQFCILINFKCLNSSKSLTVISFKEKKKNKNTHKTMQRYYSAI